MENAAEALKLAVFTLLFVAALSIAMMTIMQAKKTSEQIIKYSDKTNYSSTIQENDSYENGNRNQITKSRHRSINLGCSRRQGCKRSSIGYFGLIRGGK